MQRGCPGKRCGAAGTPSRAAPAMAAARRAAAGLPAHTAHTCTRTALSGDTRAGSHAAAQPRLPQRHIPAHACSPAAPAPQTRSAAPGPQLASPPGSSRGPGAACTPRAPAAQPRQEQSHAGPGQGRLQPPRLPPPQQGGLRRALHPGVTRRGLPCNRDPLPRAPPTGSGQRTGLCGAQEAFLHVGLACRCRQQPCHTSSPATPAPCTPATAALATARMPMPARDSQCGHTRALVRVPGPTLRLFPSQPHGSPSTLGCHRAGFWHRGSLSSTLHRRCCVTPSSRAKASTKAAGTALCLGMWETKPGLSSVSILAKCDAQRQVCASSC